MNQKSTRNALAAVDNSTNSLEHYGIKGMKWGVRRTPEQLGHKTASKKTSNQSRNLQKARKAKAAKAKKATADEKKRQEYLKSPSQLYKHRDMFTQQEIDAAMKRFQWEQNLRNMSKSEMNRGKETVDMVLGYVKTGTEAYNAFAKIYNAYQSYEETGKVLPIVGSDKEKKEKKN